MFIYVTILIAQQAGKNQDGYRSRGRNRSKDCVKDDMGKKKVSAEMMAERGEWKEQHLPTPHNVS